MEAEVVLGVGGGRGDESADVTALSPAACGMDGVPVVEEESERVERSKARSCRSSSSPEGVIFGGSLFGVQTGRRPLRTVFGGAPLSGRGSVSERA